jgi:DNA-binding CsgD family transcriptional regulator
MAALQSQLPPQLGHRGPAFVGRRRERRELAAFWDEAVAGQRRVVFIGGEPGAGKTRLASELAAACLEDGALVLAGSSTPDLGYPLQPFITALDWLFSDPPALEYTVGMDEGTLAHLARLSPQLARHSDTPPAAPSASENPGELFSAVTKLIDVLCRQAPLVLVLENLHWAGPLTRQLLRALVVSSDGHRLLVVGTHRTTAPDRSQELTRSIADLYGMTGVSRIDLTGLDTDEIAEYIGLADGATGPRIRRAAALLRDHTGGNPFFLEETWRDVGRHGGVDVLVGGVIPTPSTVRDILELRLAQLDSEASNVLGCAAVAGDDVDLDLLYEIGIEPHTALEAVDVGIAHGILDERGPAIAFRHALSRRAARDRIPRHERLRIHAELARALEKRNRATPELIAAIAHHYSEAAPLGYAEKAVESLARSAEASRRSLAHREAAASFARAAGHATGRQALELRFEAADSNCRGEDPGTARAQYRELATVDDDHLRARAAIGHEEASWEDAVDTELSLVLLQDALSHLQPGDHWHTRALASLGRALLMAGAVDEASHVAELALLRARQTGDRQLIAHALTTAVYGFALPEKLEIQYERTLELLELTDATSAINIGLAYGIGANAGYRLGIPGILEDHRIISRQLGPNFARPSITVAGLWLEAAVLYKTGRFEEALARAEAIYLQGPPLGGEKAEGPYGMQMFFIQRATGAVRSLPDSIVDAAVRGGGWKPGTLALCVERGMLDRARMLLPAVVGAVDDISPVSAQWAAVAVFAVEAAAALDDHEAARYIRERLEPFAGTNLMAGHVLVPLGSADHYRALASHVLGDHDLATRQFEAALEMDRTMDAPVHEAETLLSLAAHLESIGKVHRAEMLRKEGRDIARRIGLRRRIPLERTSAPRTPLPGGDLGLSPREIDVLRLLAAGLSNREIGDALMISTNTAANHVRSILMKTGASNRTQAAVLAANAGLL